MERYNAVVGQYQTAVLICRNQLADGANMMRTEPLSTEAGDTTVADDSYAAAQQIAALVAEQRARASTLTTSQLYDAVYARCWPAPTAARPLQATNYSDDNTSHRFT